MANELSSSSLTMERRPSMDTEIEKFLESEDKSVSYEELEMNKEDPNKAKEELINRPSPADQLKSSVESTPSTKITADDKPLTLPNFEDNPHIWMIPEPEDFEDVKDSTDYDDNDDVIFFGENWVRQSSLNAEECEKEIQSEMQEAVKRKLKNIVSRFLAAERSSLFTKEQCKSWLEIITSLSMEAALFIKPDADEGQGMDPRSYVKVKCIASGKPQESQLVKGLVFKKQTAHKHMPIHLKYPKLLLLAGAIGQSSAGLSSFDSMYQDKYHLRFISEMIEIWHPDIVMFEETVPRDIQEKLLEKHITLVSQMKHHRLERIARCIDSPILSSTATPTMLALKQCKSFHIEKFVEEHGSCAVGHNRPAKTLMFLEGFPKPLGCTILLKGASCDELKKIKHVLRYAVLVAYHLTHEASFFADQQVLSSDKDAPTLFCNDTSNKLNIAESSSGSANGPSPVLIINSGNDISSETGVGKSDDCISLSENVGPWQYATYKKETHAGILVESSIRCITKPVICEQIQPRHIEYYKDSDVALGKFLRDLLLNKACSVCQKLPCAHVYSYNHQNGCLSVFVKQLGYECLPGERCGELWMWRRCTRCELRNGIPLPTKRVRMPSSAHNLSFGMFLEFSFSDHSAASRLSKCGHLLFRDSLHFFGLGSMVAMFKYSPVDAYASDKLETKNRKGGNEVPNVCAQWNAFLSVVSNIWQKIFGDESRNLNSRSS